MDIRDSIITTIRKNRISTTEVADYGEDRCS